MTSAAPTPIDWSSFIPDSVTALLTGLVIGLFLFGMEQRRHTEDKRESAESQWTIISPKIASNLLDGKIQNVGDYGDLGSVLDVVPLVEDQPVELWHRRLRSKDLSILRESLDNLKQVEGLAYMLEARLSEHSERLCRSLSKSGRIAVERAVRSTTYGLPLAPDAQKSEDASGAVSSIRMDESFIGVERSYVQLRQIIDGQRLDLLLAIRSGRSKAYQRELDQADRREFRRQLLRHPFRAIGREVRKWLALLRHERENKRFDRATAKERSHQSR